MPAWGFACLQHNRGVWSPDLPPVLSQNRDMACYVVMCCTVQTADDLLCRALYALEGAWVHGFDPTTGNVRLDFENAPNRGLFLALFRHAQVGFEGIVGTVGRG